jgi:hypothetical protein
MMFSKWGNKEVQIEQEVVEYEPLRLILWKNKIELLYGRKAPLISKQTCFTFKLQPDGNGTNVTPFNQASGISGSTNFFNFSKDSCHPK